MAVEDYGGGKRWQLWKNKRTGRWIALPPLAGSAHAVSFHEDFASAVAHVVAALAERPTCTRRLSIDETTVADMLAAGRESALRAAAERVALPLITVGAPA